MPISKALGDLLWTFFPVLIVLLLLAMIGKADHILERTDLILMASVLFAEGSARSRKLSPWRRGGLPSIGLVGACLAAVVASVMLLSEVEDVPRVKEIVSSSRFQAFHVAMLIAAIFFGFLVRFQLFMALPSLMESDM